MRRRRPGGPLAALLLAALAALAAPRVVAAAPGEGFAPLEPCTDASPPEERAGDRPEGMGPVRKGRRDGHLWAHARAYVHAPLSTVWSALHDPAVSRLGRVDEWSVRAADDATPLAFRVAYRVRKLVFDVRWEVEYRGGALAGSVDRLEEPGATIGFRWDKRSGTDHIRVLSASLVAHEDAPGVTSLELVSWLDADRTGERDAVATLTEWYARIAAHVHDARASPGEAGP